MLINCSETNASKALKQGRKVDDRKNLGLLLKKDTQTLYKPT